VSEAYKRAGVDIQAAAKAVELIGELAAKTKRPEVTGSVAGFAGLFDIGEGRFLAAGTDGVGTKLEIARMMGRLNTVGIDLVAMCADDVVCTGAEPLLFLDYLAVGKLVPEEVAAIVEGVAEGCVQARCALLGGETAEHPGTLQPGEFDLAGFCVGIVEESKLLGRSPHISAGDLLVGLESSGLHSNGYSLVRKALVDSGDYPLDALAPGLDRPLGEELLEPTRIYAPLVLGLARRGVVTAAAHITGGGLYENIPRALPEGLGAEMSPGAWPIPPIFHLVRLASGSSLDDMYATFNMGIGMVLVVAPPDLDAVVGMASGVCPAHVIGKVVEGSGVRFL